MASRLKDLENKVTDCSVPFRVVSNFHQGLQGCYPKIEKAKKNFTPVLTSSQSFHLNAYNVPSHGTGFLMST